MATKKTGDKELNRNQIKFCEYYVSQEFFCSGVKSYQQAYPRTSYDTAKVEASKFLTNPNILAYIDKLLNDMGLNDQRVDKELAKLILQDEEKGVKLQAIKEYNNLKSRITKKLELSGGLKVDMSEEDKEMYDKILQNNLLLGGKKEMKK